MVSEVRYVSFLTVKISRIVAFNAARTFKTPLIYAHINPYGTFELDMQKRFTSGSGLKSTRT